MISESAVQSKPTGCSSRDVVDKSTTAVAVLRYCGGAFLSKIAVLGWWITMSFQSHVASMANRDRRQEIAMEQKLLIEFI